ncbi:trypsin-like peptidase domain-containing protein [Streptomyces sp. HNM0574]|uniref:trypsin-like peptidase domain-containing protein n=1 Tax=Streptomyces sp. HNM0574 TaxID=2714954 RepID=UPI00146E8C6D|nr:trypsin-like peptidase domain-containing protein [Streptomyces sp. HNM0574]NLU68341.1 serine protease [Streptomyces sp. HNM0574]
MELDDGLRAEHVAEIIVGLPDGAGRRGSGCLTAPARVLTAAHVVAGASALRVRFDADRPGERTVEAAVAWRHEGIDVAVLALPEADGQPAAKPLGFGRIPEQDAVLRCSAVGFPRFKLRAGEDASRFRDSEHVLATCALLSNRREGTLDLTVTPPGEARAADVSPWEGMSGAAVLSGGRIVGVVARHHRSDGPGRIAASRVDRWAERLTARELAELEAALGHGLGTADLPNVLPPDRLGLVEAAYTAQLRDIAPEELLGRERDLRRLVAFCAGAEPYLWLQGPPWAGKTALAASFALHPPRGVVPVWFFVTSRFAGQADSEAYTDAVVHQLAAVAGREPSGHASPVARDGERRQLLHEAAERVARDAGTLLLVVDGLDEDQSAAAGGRTPSIASLLPQRLPPNVRVLVTSRPRPGVPPDVGGGHPLRHCTVRQLATVEAARHTEHEARYELSDLLLEDELGREMVGLLAAARGSLTSFDLRELTLRTKHEVERHLGGTFGRILRTRGTFAEYDSYTGTRGFLFAHETLLVAALEALGPDIGPYRTRLHAWADGYAARGWPEETPAYLLQPYTRMLLSLGDVRRATALATDAGRHERMREVTGGDAAALAETEAVRAAVRDADPDDVGSQAVLVAAADLLARRNQALPPELPLAAARLGQFQRAVSLARSSFRAVDRARALAGVARVLAETGGQRDGDDGQQAEGDRRRAVSLAREAVALATEERLRDRRRRFRQDTDDALHTAAVALTRAGREDEALRLLPRGSGGGSRPLVPAELALAARRAGSVRADELWSRAEEAAEGLPTASQRIGALAAMAEACAEDEPGRAGRLFDRVRHTADAEPATSTAVTSAAAAALARARPREAARYAERTDGWAAFLTRHAGAGENVRLAPTHDAVCALAVTGEPVKAQELIELTRGRFDMVRDFPPHVWASVALAWAHHGHAGATAQALRELREAAGSPPSLVPYRLPCAIGRALAREGQVRDLEGAVAEVFPDPREAAEALAAAAGALVGSEPGRAVEVLGAAEHAASRAGSDAVDRKQDEASAALATGCAAIGELADAERLIGTIGSPDIRAGALAAVSLADTGARLPDAPSLAEAAAQEAGGVGGIGLRSHAIAAAAQALADAGEGERAMALADCLEPNRPWEYGHLPQAHALRDACRTSVAARLWRHDPAAAAALADRIEGRARTEAGSYGAVLPLAGLLAATGRRDPERARRLAEALVLLPLDEPRGARADNRVLRALLCAGTEPEASRRLLEEAEPGAGSFDTTGALALARVVSGDDKAAEDLVDGVDDASERAELYAALASYLTGGDEVPPLVLPFGTHRPVLRTALALAAYRTPPPAGPATEGRARRFLDRALAGEGWYHAVPVLAAVDPATVERVRDVAFAHLGLRTGRRRRTRG